MLLLALSALAQEPADSPEPATAAAPEAPLAASVFVSGFQPLTSELGGVAAVLENLLADALEQQPGIRPVRVEDTPAFEDYSARIYLDGCPDGESVGCAFVLAERGAAQWAVAGSMSERAEGGLRLQVSIMNVPEARVVVSFQSDLAPGEDQTFVDGVVRVLLAAIRGEIGAVTDIRRGGEEEEATADRASPEQLAAQIAELSTELGEVSRVMSSSPRTLTRPEYTVDDLAGEMEGEGVKPWERLGMSPAEYLSFKNSGKSVEDWRATAVGRQFQVLVRAYGGLWRGPVDSEFYGRYAYNTALDVVGSYSSLGVQIGSGPVGGAEVAFGLLSFLDVGLAGGVAAGHMLVDVAAIQSDGTTVETPTSNLQSTTWWFGPRAVFAPFPTWVARPSAGLGATIARSPGSESLVGLNEGALHVDERWVAYAHLFLGGEVRMSKRLDFIVRVPIDLQIGGNDFNEAFSGNSDLVAQPGQTTDAALATGIVAGFQVRLAGRQAKSTIYDD